MSSSHPNHGLAILRAASIALASYQPSKTPPTPTPDTTPSSTEPSPQQPSHQSQPSSLFTLLNPAPSAKPPALPPGFVQGNDGKIKKKRGRKPTPGLTDEDRRQARLLKNRRTAEVSRRRKLALLTRLTAERDDAVAIAARLRKENAALTQRLADALHTSVPRLLGKDPAVAMRFLPGASPSSPAEQSEISAACTADSDSDLSAKKS